MTHKKSHKFSLFSWWQSHSRPWNILPPHDKPLLSWRAPEFYLVDKSVGWGIAVIVIFVALALFLIFVGKILLAALSIVFLVTILKLAYETPQTLNYRIDIDGLRVAGWLHPFGKELRSFWAGRQNHRAVLYLNTNNFWSKYLVVPLGNTTPGKVAKILKKYLPEEQPSLQVPKVRPKKART